MQTNEAHHIAYVHTSASKGCDFCNKWLDGASFDWAVNHYITEHGGTVLHIGGATTSDDYGKALLHTVAAIGFRNVPPKREPPEVVTTGFPPGP